MDWFSGRLEVTYANGKQTVAARDITYAQANDYIRKEIAKQRPGVREDWNIVDAMYHPYACPLQVKGF